MKLLLAMALAMTGCACGPETLDLRTNRVEPTHWIVVDTATLKIRSVAGLYAVTPLDVNIVWTEPERGKFDVDCSGLSVDATDPDLLEVGTCTIDTIRINKLKVCGVNEDEKCTASLIRMYTTGDYAGFINITEGYGVPFLSDGNEVGLSTANALTLDSYTIPGSDRRLRNNDFTDLSYDLSIDMSNAGIGEYEMDVSIELLLGI